MDSFLVIWPGFSPLSSRYELGSFFPHFEAPQEWFKKRTFFGSFFVTWRGFSPLSSGDVLRDQTPPRRVLDDCGAVSKVTPRMVLIRVPKSDSKDFFHFWYLFDRQNRFDNRVF